MKKILAVLLVSLLLLSLSSCENKTSYEKGYTDGYDEGYSIGYDDGTCDSYFDDLTDVYFSGKDEGIDNTLDYVADALYDELWDLERNTAKKYGLHPDEAAVVLDDFINGKSVSKEELQIAIDSICGYYYDSSNLPDAIKDMDLYID